MLPQKIVMTLKNFIHSNIMTEETHNIEITHKNKSLSLFHINSYSLKKNFDELQHLLSCTKTKFDIIAISETRITKEVSLSNNLPQLRLVQVLPFLTTYHINVEIT